MPTRFEWSEIAIVGATGGVAGCCLMLAYFLGADANNLLNFFGGAVGSGTAIAATLWLEKRKRQRAFDHMIVTLLIIANGAVRYESSDDRSSVVLTLNLLQGLDAFDVARQGIAIENPYMQFALQSSLYWILKSRRELEALFDKHEQGEMRTEDFAIHARRLARVILQQIDYFVNRDGIAKVHKDTFRIHKEQGDAGLLAVTTEPLAGG